MRPSGYRKSLPNRDAPNTARGPFLPASDRGTADAVGSLEGGIRAARGCGARRPVPGWRGADEGRSVNGPLPADVVIRTPDQRLRVFVSSTLGELDLPYAPRDFAIRGERAQADLALDHL